MGHCPGVCGTGRPLPLLRHFSVIPVSSGLGQSVLLRMMGEDTCSILLLHRKFTTPRAGWEGWEGIFQPPVAPLLLPSFAFYLTPYLLGFPVAH